MRDRRGRFDLIDEARTPLIISGQVERPQEKYQKAAEVANALARAAELGKDGVDPEGDYEVDGSAAAPSPMKASPRLSKCLVLPICSTPRTLGSLHHQRPEGQGAVCERCELHRARRRSRDRG